MRSISLLQIGVFLGLLCLIVALSIITTAFVFKPIPLGDFRGIVVVLATTMVVFIYGALVYRLFIALWPFGTGEIPLRSVREFSYHIHILFFLIIFYPVLGSGLIPLPLIRSIYILLGAKLGPNSYGSGVLLDPIFVHIGANCIIGHDALLVPHVIEGTKLAHYPIKIGNNVTLGARSIIMADVEIGDGAVVGMNAVVTKGTRIGAGEKWVGVPAQPLHKGVDNS